MDGMCTYSALMWKSLRISHKGILLIALPLVCEVIFFCMLIGLVNGLENAIARETRSREIVAAANSILLDVNRRCADRAFLELMRSGVAVDLGSLQGELDKVTRLMSYSPEQTRNAELLNMHAKQASQIATGLEETFLFGSGDRSALTRRDLRIVLGKLFGDLNRIKEVEERYHRDAKFETGLVARQKLKSVLTAGVVFNVLVTLLFLDLLESGTLGNLTEQAMIGVGKSKKSMVHLVGMVNDLLEIEKMEAGSLKLDRRSIGLALLVEDAVSAVESLLAANDIECVRAIDSSIIVAVDRQRILQVLQNLLSNAIKFSPTKSRIEITAAISDTGVVVKVIDNGLGIAADLVPSIFDRFAAAA